MKHLPILCLAMTCVVAYPPQVTAQNNPATYPSTYPAFPASDPYGGSYPDESNPVSSPVPYQPDTYSDTNSGPDGYISQAPTRADSAPRTSPTSTSPTSTSPTSTSPTSQGGPVSDGPHFNAPQGEPFPGPGSSPYPIDSPVQEEGWSFPRLTIPNLSVPEYELWSTESWLSPTQWDGSIEFGINGSEGNAQALSIRGGMTAKRTTDRHELNASLTYVKATADGLETAHSAIFNGRDEWLLGESPWSLFWTNALEYDEFRAFDLRLVLAAGVGYRVVDDGITKMGYRFGSGVSREFGGPDTRWVPEANFGFDYERKISERQTLSATVDYYPEWANFRDYRMNTSLDWIILLDAETDMSLKFSILDRYDSTPNGRKPNDITYSALLLWKF